jgi:hypothetical protein
MKPNPPHLKALEEIKIERDGEGIPGLVEVLREEGIDAVFCIILRSRRGNVQCLLY